MPNGLEGKTEWDFLDLTCPLLSWRHSKTDKAIPTLITITQSLVYFQLYLSLEYMQPIGFYNVYDCLKSIYLTN